MKALLQNEYAAGWYRIGVRVAFGIAFAALSIATGQPPSLPEPGILNTLNRLRADPAGYAAVLRQRRPWYRGNLFRLPGQPDLITQEGVRPLDEAINMLQSMRIDVGRLALSAGLSRAAADHVLDAGRRGQMGHAGSDGSDFATRIARYGTWAGEVGEDIGYGQHEDRELVDDLLIDDGVASRGHRKSLLDPRWRYVGIACGPHVRYGIMCVLDFAATYQDR